MSLHVSAATPEERDAALQVFFQHLSDEERQTRVQRTLAALANGDLPAEGLLVCRAGNSVSGAITALPLEGAAGLVWPPQTVGGVARQAIENLLMQSALSWLRQRGAKFAQVFLAAADLPFAAPLERHGCKHITTLLYLHKDLNSNDNQGTIPLRLRCQSYTTCDKEKFHATLLASYEGTFDCPELNGLRTSEEIVAGYRAIPGCQPDHWWLAWHEDQPVGVLITMPVQDSPAWELGYVGLTPTARRRGFGTELTRKAMAEAWSAGAPAMMLTVDERNAPAQRLYHSLGFTESDRREVFLAIFAKT